MSKEQFTPGPWKAHQGIMEPDYVFFGEEENCDEENRVVCECFLRPGKHELSRDVFLIAAAPEMYNSTKDLAECLAEVITAIINGDDFPDALIAMAQEEVEKAANILKKARGEEC